MVVCRQPNSYRWAMTDPMPDVQQDASLNGEVEIGGFPIQVHDGRGVLPKGVAVRGSSAGRSGPKPRGSTSLRRVRRPAAYEPDAMTARIVEALGSNVTAGLLGVSKDRPTRWVKGVDRPSGESRARLADLDSLVGQMLAVFTPDQAVLWLNGEDPFLQARPLDVFQIEGSTRVIEAMRAYEQGAYA